MRSIIPIQIRYLVYFIILICINACTPEKRSDLSISALQCDYKKSPAGIGKEPVFSWILESNKHNQIQTSYQVIIAEKIGDLKSDENVFFNSGKVNSDASIGVVFEDLKLKAGTKYYWKVRVWDKNDMASQWSKPANFITGLFTEEDWSGAKWISLEEMDDSLVLVPGIPTWGYNTIGIATRRAKIPQFRKELRTGKKVASAYLFISGLGHYIAYLNGVKLGEAHMAPGWTNYHETCLYNTYDITEKIKKGGNAIGILAGTGFYNINNERYRKLLITYGMPKTIAKLLINYTDGTSSTLVTDESWKVSPSPITYSSIYGGENYDATLEQEGWNSAGFDDSSWQDALLAKPPGGELKPEISYPVKKIRTFIPVKTIKKGLDTFAFDFSQNASAIVEIQLKGNKGDTVRIYPSELYFEELRENQRWTGWPYYYEYILKGEGVETWSPMFTYYGMRYAHVIGAQPTAYKTNDSIPELLTIKMHHISNSSPIMGSFWCSNNLFNRIDTLIRYAIKSNMQSVLTDCPHRERLGWIEQTYLMGNSIKFNYDIYHLYSKLVGDMMDSQHENGLVANMAPEFICFGDAFSDSPEWGSAVIQVPWLIYKWYGDISLMGKAWDSMLNYIEYLDSKAENDIISYGLGDWYDIGPELPGFSQLTPITATATAIYYLDYKVMAQIAGLLGKSQKDSAFQQKAEEIRKAYNNLLFDAEKNIYATGSQTAMAIPLSMGIVENEYREKVLRNLVDSILANSKTLTAGDIGFHYLIDALTEGNYSQLVYEMNNRDDVPGYGYQIKKGATALTESWDALQRKSNNHLMLGHLMEWFYKGLGGIRQEDKSAAYKNIIIKPSVVEGLEEVKTSYETPYGTIVSEWNNSEEELTMTVVIPVNTTANIYIPSSSYDEIREGSILLENNPEIEILETTQTYKRIKVGSGSYRFIVEKNRE